MKIPLLVFMSEIKIDLTQKRSNFLFLLCFKIPLLVFMSEIKIDLTQKSSNFLFLLFFKFAIIQLIPMRQPSRQRHISFSRRFTSNLMLPVYLLGMI